MIRRIPWIVRRLLPHESLFSTGLWFQAEKKVPQKKTAKNDCRGSDLLPYGERKENEEKNIRIESTLYIV